MCIALGTGVGGGVVIGGRVHLGLGHAGEIGHTTVDPDGPLCGCGNHGCLDRMAGADAIAAAAGRATVAEAAEAARAGDPPAVAAFAKAGEQVGRVLAGAIVLLWPERVVVGGGVAAAGELLLEPIRAEIRRRACVAPVDEIDVVAAELGPQRRRRGRRAVGRRGARGRAVRLGVAAALVDGVPVPGDVSVADGRVEAVGLGGAGAGLAVPGFVDLQVNGFAGVDFLTAEPEDYARVDGALAATGVTAYLPTFITAAASEYRRALAVLSAAGPRRLGAHIEGPFLSPAWPGAHPPEHLLEPDLALVDELRGDRADHDDDGRARAAGRARARGFIGRARHRRAHRPHRCRRRDRPRGVRPRRAGADAHPQRTPSFPSARPRARRRRARAAGRGRDGDRRRRPPRRRDRRAAPGWPPASDCA